MRPSHQRTATPANHSPGHFEGLPEEHQRPLPLSSFFTGTDGCIVAEDVGSARGTPESDERSNCHVHADLGKSEPPRSLAARDSGQRIMLKLVTSLPSTFVPVKISWAWWEVKIGTQFRIHPFRLQKDYDYDVTDTIVQISSQRDFATQGP